MRVDNGPVAINQSAQQAKEQSKLSVDDFLQIMAAEIQNQNPSGESGGGSKTDYLTQLAQFTTLEQMTDISEGISQLSMLSQASLIGKTVKVYGETEDVVGIVDKVKFYNNQTYLSVNNADYPLGMLIEVEDTVKEDPMRELLTEIRDSVNTIPSELTDIKDSLYVPPVSGDDATDEL